MATLNTILVMIIDFVHVFENALKGRQIKYSLNYQTVLII